MDLYYKICSRSKERGTEAEVEREKEKGWLRIRRTHFLSTGRPSAKYSRHSSVVIPQGEYDDDGQV